MAAEPGLTVTLAYCPAPGSAQEWTLQLVPGSTVAQALQASGVLRTLGAAEVDTLTVGLWGRKVGLEQQLRAHDRIELYRPLTVDPKVARRERFARQGARKSGLFAQRRAGAKAGY